MTTCEEIQDARKTYGVLPRDYLPRWLHVPRDWHEFQMAIAVLTVNMGGIEPVCKDGELVSWRVTGCWEINPSPRPPTVVIDRRHE